MMQIRAALRILVLTLGLTAIMGPVVAQDLGTPISPILVVDSDRVFRASQLGRRIDEGLKARLEALVAENKQIETELTDEELSLTEQRATLPVADFRKLADAFDQKVQAIRSEQDAKQRTLQQLRDDQSSSFSAFIEPILRQIAVERGAIAILERRSVLMLADSIDITDEVIARINSGNMSVPAVEPKDETVTSGTD